MRTFKTWIFLLFIMFVEIKVILMVDTYMKAEEIQNDYILFGVGILTGSILAFIILFTYAKIKKRFFKGAVK